MKRRKKLTQEVMRDWNYLTRHFNANYVLNKMEKEEYVIGLKNSNSFCYIVERKLRPLGSILGATSFKFGLYYGRTKKDNVDKYRSTLRFGKTPEEAFKKIKIELSNLISETKKLAEYKEVKSLFNGMFKHKIMYLYNPEIMVPSFNEDDLKYFAERLKLIPEKTYEKLQFQMLNYKKKYRSSLSNYEFMVELYSTYGRPVSKDEVEINDYQDVKLNRSVLSNKNITKKYNSHPEKRKSVKKGKDDICYYPRDPEMSNIALIRAKYKCEYNKRHFCFERRKNGTGYTEVHHLIPLCYYDEFDYSLDVPANIVSLCSSCHKEIHYGKNADQLIINLFNNRRKELKKAGIDITIEKLLNKYHQINKRN